MVIYWNFENTFWFFGRKNRLQLFKKTLVDDLTQNAKSLLGLNTQDQLFTFGLSFQPDPIEKF